MLFKTFKCFCVVLIRKRKCDFELGQFAKYPDVRGGKITLKAHPEACKAQTNQLCPPAYMLYLLKINVKK